MTIAIRNAVGSNNAGGGTSITMTMPTNVNGDTLIMHISVVGGTGTAITTPAGWTFIRADNSTTALKQAWYYRIASSEPANYVVTITSNKASGTVTSISGVVSKTARELTQLTFFADANLVSYYKMEDTSDSKGSNTLTNNNSCTFVAGKFNNGGSQGSSNTNKYFSTGNNLGIAGNGDISICGWVNWNTSAGQQVIFAHYSTTGADRYFYCEVTGGTYSLSASGTSVSFADASFTTGVWYHICVTRNVSGNLGSLYINGILQGTTTLGSTTLGVNKFNIGADTTPGVFSSAIYDDVAIFSRVLSQWEVLQIYGSNPFAGLSSSVNASSATITAATLGTFDSCNGIDLFLGGSAVGTTVLTNPTNYTLGSQSASTGGGPGSRTTSSVEYRVVNNVTTVGSLTQTYNAAAVNIGHHLFIIEGKIPSPIIVKQAINRASTF